MVPRTATPEATRPSAVRSLRWILTFVFIFGVVLVQELYLGFSESVPNTTTTTTTSNRRNTLTDSPPQDDAIQKDPASTVPHESAQCASFLKHLLPGTSHNGLSIHSVWSALRPRLSSFAIQRIQDQLTTGQINVTSMKEDVMALQERFFGRALVEKSMIHPLRTQSAEALLRIVAARLDDPENNPPLRVYTYGGSPVFGTQSFYNEWWLPNTTIGNEGYELDGRFVEFPWPVQLEKIWNDALFGGRDVIQVHNMAAGGVSTETGVLSLQCRQFGNSRLNEDVQANQETVLPDVIIHAYSNNDVPFHFHYEAKGVQMTVDFVEAARKLRCDNENLPAVVFYEDFVGVNNTYFPTHILASRNFRTVASLTSWYDLLGISFGAAFQNLHYSDDDHLRFGVGDWIHPRLIYHAAVAPWLLSYGLLSGIVGLCEDERHEGLLKETVNNNKDASTDQSRRLGAAAVAKTGPPDLEPAHIPPFRDMKYGSVEFTDAWREQTAKDLRRCASPSATNPCLPQSFLATRVGGLNHRSQLDQKLQEMQLSNVTGWETVGKDGVQRGEGRIGWEASTKGASFTVTVPDAREGLKIVLLPLVSYGERWAGSKLRVTARHPGDDTPLGTFTVNGVHESHTSVTEIQKLALDPKKLRPGGRVEAKFDLIGGSLFKLFGIMFCVDLE